MTVAQKRSICEQTYIATSRHTRQQQHKSAFRVKFQAVRSLIRDSTICRNTSRSMPAEQGVTEFRAGCSRSQKNYRNTSKTIPSKTIQTTHKIFSHRQKSEGIFSIEMTPFLVVLSGNIDVNFTSLVRRGFPINTHRTCLFSYHVRDEVA